MYRYSKYGDPSKAFKEVDGRWIQIHRGTDENWLQYQRWLSLGNTPDRYEQTKEQAFETVEDHIYNKALLVRTGSFTHLGVEYSLLGIEDVTRKKIKDKAKDYLVMLADGKKKVKMTKAEWDAYADALIDRLDEIEDNEMAHLTALEALVADGGSTIDDVLAYDYTTGWEQA